MAKTKSTKNTKSRSTKSTPTKSRKTTSTSKMKAEVAEELNVDLGANATARENGKVGAEVKKRSRSTSKPSKTKKSKKN